MMNGAEFIVNVEFEATLCDFCHSTDATLLFEGPDRSLKLPGVFKLVRCNRCGVIRQDPRPTMDTIGRYYSADYEPYLKAIVEERSAWRRLNRRYGMYKRWRHISAYKQQGVLLDVGCAAGNFLYEMHRQGGWVVQGVEPNVEMATYAQNYYGFDIHVGTLSTFEAPAASFDVVTLWHVLEHMHYPRKNLEKIHQLLKPGGLLVFSIPNTNSIDARWFGHYWFGWELPRHLYHFPEDVMKDWLRRLGFQLQSIRCIGGSHEIFTLSLLQFLEAKSEQLTRGQLRLVNFFRSQPIRVAMGPVFWVLDRFRLGSVYAFLATKD
jgi:SAM-dependent methyltransferase